MLDVGVQLGVSVGHSVGHVDLVTRVHEAVIETHGPVGPLFLRIEVIDFFLVGALLVRHIFAALLDPASLALLQITIHFRRPN